MTLANMWSCGCRQKEKGTTCSYQYILVGEAIGMLVLKQRFHFHFKKKTSKTNQLLYSPSLVMVFARYHGPTTRSLFLDARSTFHLFKETHLGLALDTR